MVIDKARHIEHWKHHHILFVGRWHSRVTAAFRGTAHRARRFNTI